MFLSGLISVLLLFQTNLISATSHAPAINLTSFLLLQRQRRSLIFQERGSISINVGQTLNVELGDPVAWRSLIYIFNLHGGQYPLPTTPSYPWDKWEELYARTLHQKMYALGKYHEDDGRLFVYTALENYIDRQSDACFKRGRTCVLRAICENAQVDHHTGIFAELLNILLTPGFTKLDHVYFDAQNAGKSGVNCLKAYQQCPFGCWVLDGYLDEFY